MRIGMRLLLGYFLIVAVAAVFCNIARFAPISAGSSKCAMNTMST